MPSNRPSSSKVIALTIRPSSRATRTRSVRYSSPSPARAERVDPAAEPRGIKRVQASVDLVALHVIVGRADLHDALDGPELAADHAAEARRIGGEDGGEGDCGIVVAPLLEDGGKLVPRERDVARQHEDLVDVGDTSARAARTAWPVPRGTSWSANTARAPERLGQRAVGGAPTTTGAAPPPGRRPPPTRRGRTRASAGRTGGGGPWACPISSACRGRQP